MVIKFNIKRFLISIAIPLSVGGLSALLTKDNMNFYSKIVTPTFVPPGWLFPVVWTILYLLMGVSLYLVWSSEAGIYEKRRALVIFALQLLLNFIWSPIFFNMQWFLMAFIVLVLLWLFTFGMILSFYNISKIAGILQIPYLLWLTFAGYLNLAIYILN
ncbi:MAG: tryptophan-rich sensory protein [Clostridia bacterium]|nr:tryptophan-rich sensory protein [Clostridia bacterium]